MRGGGGTYPVQREQSRQAQRKPDRAESSSVHCHQIPHPRGQGSSDRLPGSRGKLRLGEESGLPGSLSACPVEPALSPALSITVHGGPCRPQGASHLEMGRLLAGARGGNNEIPGSLHLFQNPGAMPGPRELGRGRTGLWEALVSPRGSGSEAQEDRPGRSGSGAPVGPRHQRNVLRPL